MARINVPVLTRSLLILIFGLTTLNVLTFPNYNFSLFLFFGRVSEYLGIVKETSYKLAWTFITATFVERNLFGLLVTSSSVFFGGRYLERAWGLTEFFKFILVVSVFPNLLTRLLYIVIPSTPICGGVAIQAGLLVAFKQLEPEHTVIIHRGALRMRVKHFPAFFLLLNFLSGIILHTQTAMFLSWFGVLTSWIYLRFFCMSPLLDSASTELGAASIMRGDASDTFAFAYFFPDPLHTPIAHVCDAIYQTMILLHICTPWPAEVIAAGNEAAMARASGNGLPTTWNNSARREESDRRRALALKALDRRLHAVETRAAAASTNAVEQHQQEQPITITVPAPVVPPEPEVGET